MACGNAEPVQRSNAGRATLIFLAGVIASSCSEKSDPERSQNSKAEKAEASLRSPAGTEERPNLREVERSSGSAVESAEAEKEGEQEPPADEIGEDCVAFLRSTKTIPAVASNSDCPQCPVSSEGSELLKFNDIRVDRVVRSGSTCEVDVTIRATFNPSTHEQIAGGLTAWISPEQKANYSQGETPSGQQVYKVKIIYRRDRNGWRAVEFDRQEPKP